MKRLLSAYHNLNPVLQAALNAAQVKPREIPENAIKLTGGQYAIINQAEGEDDAVIDIYGVIGFDFWKWLEDEPQNDAETMRDRLRAITAKTITVNIDSTGGSVADAISIMDLLIEKDATVTTILRGMSASAATIISQSATRGNRMMSKNAMMLIHKAMLPVVAWVNENAAREILNELEPVGEVLNGIYADAGAKPEEVAKLMDANGGYGIWISANRALEIGLIDAIYDPREKEEENAVSNSIKNKLEREGLLQTKAPEATPDLPDNDLPKNDKTEEGKDSHQKKTDAAVEARQRTITMEKMRFNHV